MTKIKIEEHLKKSFVLFSYSMAKLLSPLSPKWAGQWASYAWFSPLRLRSSYKPLKSKVWRQVNYKKRTINIYRYAENQSPKGSILLVHGWAGHQGQFNSLIEALVSDGYQAFSFDFRPMAKPQA